jgi:hypothetical protein
MPTQSLLQYVCDNNPAHIVVTIGPTPDGWVQMVPSWGDGSSKFFDTMTCAGEWYTAETPF